MADSKNMDAAKKQKMTAIIVAILFIIIAWQVIAMFNESEESAAPAPTTAANGKAQQPTPNNQSQQQGPQPAAVQTVSLPRDQQMELIRLQQETQAKYVVGLNELQLLKLAKDIADINKEIAAAKLAMINSQKEIIDKLQVKQQMTPETQIPYGQNLVAPIATGSTVGNLPTPQALQNQQTPRATYTVISVSKLMNKWSAVVGSQGKLFSVTVGDTMPTDGSLVKSIDRTGVVLEKDGDTRKISIVPII